MMITIQSYCVRFRYHSASSLEIERSSNSRPVNMTKDLGFYSETVEPLIIVCMFKSHPLAARGPQPAGGFTKLLQCNSVQLLEK